MSSRLKLTLSYTGFLLIASVLLLSVVALFLLRYVPDGRIDNSLGGFVPNRSDLMRAFLPPAFACLFFLLLLGLIGGWFLAGRMLAPLARLDAAARRAAEGSLSHRVNMPGPRDEFRNLADVFDTMLARLEAHVAEQQRFAANASHELRTPLAISQAMLEVARDDPARDVDVLIDRLQHVNMRAIDLTEALLLLGRIDGGAFERDRVDLSLLAEEAAETLIPLAEARDIALEVGGTPAFTAGSSALLQQLTLNLVHNAIAHNLPAEGTVTVRTETHPEGAVLIVENTGDPLTPELVSILAEPFQRGQQRARSGDHAGAGLGLAIVDRIVHAHAGSLFLTPRTGGGLFVMVRLPSVDARA